MRLQIDENECDRCGTCISICPCDALVLTEKLSVNNETCTVCGTCVGICPVKALSLS